jgi:hypothetical protein
VFGGGRNQQNGTEFFDGWGGSLPGNEVLLMQRRWEMSDVAKKESVYCTVPTWRYFE